MSERSGPGVEEAGASITPYAEFLRRQRERLARTPENAAVFLWFSERLAGLPDMRVRLGNLTGEGGWGYETTSDGKEVKKITSGFFDAEGYYIDSGRTNQDGKPIGWNQLGITQKESPVTLPTPERTLTMKVSGLVGVIKCNYKGEEKYLIDVGQEPLADSEKHALVRTPFQTSAAKLQGLLEGKKELDPSLYDVLQIIGKGKTPSEMFASGELEAFPLPYADANRIKATNLGFRAIVTDGETMKKLETNGRRWCTEAEIKALAEAGLVNGHTIAAIFPKSGSASPQQKAA